MDGPGQAGRGRVSRSHLRGLSADEGSHVLGVLQEEPYYWSCGQDSLLNPGRKAPELSFAARRRSQRLRRKTCAVMPRRRCACGLGPYRTDAQQKEDSFMEAPYRRPESLCSASAACVEALAVIRSFVLLSGSLLGCLFRLGLLCWSPGCKQPRLHKACPRRRMEKQEKLVHSLTVHHARCLKAGLQKRSHDPESIL